MYETKKDFILKHYYSGTQNEAIKRHAKKINNNLKSQMQYGNALFLSKKFNVDVSEIIN